MCAKCTKLQLSLETFQRMSISEHALELPRPVLDSIREDIFTHRA